MTDRRLMRRDTWPHVDHDVADFPTPTIRFGAHLLPLQGSDDDLRKSIARAYSLNALARSLSRISRFNGHAEGFVSVAQHSVLTLALARVFYPADASLARLALYHDAHEAIVGDVPTPIKRAVGQPWDLFEDAIERLFREVLELASDPHAVDAVHSLDRLAFVAEDARWRRGHSVEHVLGELEGATGKPIASSAPVFDLLELDRAPKEAEGLFIAAALGIG